METYSQNKKRNHFHNDQGRFHSYGTEKSYWSKNREHDKHYSWKAKQDLDSNNNITYLRCGLWENL